MPYIGKRKEGKGRVNLGQKERLPPPVPFRTFLPLPFPPSIDLALQPEGTIIKKVVPAMIEKNLLCPPPTCTSLTLLVAPYYFFITCCIWKLYHTAKQPLFVRRSRTREWSNKRPGASWRAKINVTLGRCAKTTRFFHSPYTSRSSRALRENHMRVPWKKKGL